MSKLLHTRDAADYLGLTPTTLEHWRCLRKGPPFVKIGPRAIRYRLSDLLGWIEGRVDAPQEMGVPK
jgi:predicted DNA-binding transcriptional regulator AlpA